MLYVIAIKPTYIQTVLMTKNHVFFLSWDWTPDPELCTLSPSFPLVRPSVFHSSIASYSFPFPRRHFRPFIDRRVLVDIIIIHLHKHRWLETQPVRNDDFDGVELRITQLGTLENKTPSCLPACLLLPSASEHTAQSNLVRRTAGCQIKYGWENTQLGVKWTLVHVRSSKSAWINLHTTLNAYVYGWLGIKSDKSDLSNLKLDDVGDCGESERERERKRGGGRCG